MIENFIEEIYETVSGQTLQQLKMPGVENMFEPEKPCAILYNQAMDAYLRICSRLGIDDDDPYGFPPEDYDLNTIMGCMDDICKLVALEMFRYGVKFHDECSSLNDKE